MAKPAGNSDVGTYVLLGVVLVGVYLVYRSISNLGSTLTGAASSAGSYIAGVGDTAATEFSNLASLPTAAFNSLSTLGTSAYNSGSSTLSDLWSGLPDYFSGVTSGDPTANSYAQDLFGDADPFAQSLVTSTDPLSSFENNISPLFNVSPSLMPLPAQTSTYVNGDSNGDGNLPDYPGGTASGSYMTEGDTSDD